MYQPPVGYEIRDLTVTAANDLAFSHAFGRLSGTVKNVHRTGIWVRWTACFRKVDGKWLIAHDQVSVPLDLPSGRGLIDLQP